MGAPEPDDLGDLIQRARAQDERAMAELLQIHAQRLRESIRSELGDRLRQRQESQDVMQQVYLDALRSIAHFVDRGHDSFFAWLRRIALNRICDLDRQAFQAAKRRGEVRLADLALDASRIRLLDDLSSSGTSPSMAADLGDRIRLLEGALAQLTPAQSEVLDLRYMENLSVAETAEKVGRSERAVRSLCVRALIRLRELLGDAV